MRERITSSDITQFGNQGDRALLCAVIELAIKDYLKGKYRIATRATKNYEIGDKVLQTHYLTAKSFLFTDELNNICEYLSLNPEVIRKGVMKLKAEGKERAFIMKELIHTRTEGITT